MKISGGNMTNEELSERLRQSPDWHEGKEISYDIDFNKPPAHRDVDASTDHPYCPRPEDPGGDCACGLPIEAHDPVPPWTPTPENINALPAPLRKYIDDLETRCDPAGDVRARVLAEDAVRALELEVVRLEGVADQTDYESKEKEAAQKAAYDQGYEEGGEAMREAVIREVSQ